jgi:hypothetical protein
MNPPLRIVEEAEVAPQSNVSALRRRVNRALSQGVINRFPPGFTAYTGS